MHSSKKKIPNVEQYNKFKEIRAVVYFCEISLGYCFL